VNGLQFAYQALVGGAFFVATLWACTRSARPSPSDRLAVRVVVVGMTAVLAAQAAWILAAGGAP
jgi:hypothetical protein